MAFIDESSILEGITKADRIDFTMLEESAFQSEEDYHLLGKIFQNLSSNKVADAILYSRLSQRLEYLSSDEESYDSEVREDMENVSEILDEHSEEEFEFFKDVFSLAMELGLACDMDYTTIPEASSRKFQSFQEMIDFVQTRELQSLYKFYTLFKVLKNNSVLTELSEEAQLDYLNIVKSIVLKEIEHFEDLAEYSDVGQNRETQDLIKKIQTDTEGDL